MYSALCAMLKCAFTTIKDSMHQKFYSDHKGKARVGDIELFLEIAIEQASSAIRFSDEHSELMTYENEIYDPYSNKMVALKSVGHLDRLFFIIIERTKNEIQGITALSTVYEGLINEIAITELGKISKLSLKPEKDMQYGLQSKFAVANTSSSLRNLAIEIGKIANDIRLMASGPIAGLAEIGIPAVHAGSSIMPGKVNPSLAECMNMICFNIIGNDTAVSYAAQSGQFELNVMLPGMLKCMLESTDMLKNFLPIFSANLIDGLTANKNKLRKDIENSPVIVTLLTPKIGYLKSAALFKESLKTGKTIRELVVSKKLLSNKEIDSLFG